ncbi:major royal jelly protein-like 9 precursor [Nasonia vitripennis]|uniref:Bee-milk protein n=1 Tax=Nasonia vitripennis TaxID=7425 RepID=A0A7M6ULN9_NASVI|nr:major royal jelly protein-like 9 precursor [Nasonia vitripennis]
MTYTLLLWIFAFILGIGASSDNLETIYEWKYLKVTPLPLEYLTESRREGNKYVITKINKYNETAFFNYRKVVPFDVDVSSDGRVFITVVPKSDVKVSLLTVSNTTEDNGPLLEPYPDHSWHAHRTDCRKIISAWSITIDSCNRLWVLDSGRVDRVEVCPAKLMAFNLKDNTLIKSYEMPKNVYANAKNRSALVNPVIHTNKLQCDNFTVFIADSEGYGLIAFDGKTFRRFEGSEYNPQSEHQIFHVAGESFPLPGGIVPMDLDPAGKQLFFAPLASRALSAQNTNDLVKGNKPATTGANDIFDGQATAFRWSNRDVLFAGLTSTKIVCWNRKSELCEDDFDTVAEDQEKLQYITALKMIPEESSKSGEEELLVMTNRLQKSINRSRNFDEINFRVMKGKVRQLIKDTACEGAVCDECYGHIYGEITD